MKNHERLCVLHVEELVQMSWMMRMMTMVQVITRHGEEE
jgi:hypothetical protein